MSYIVQRNHRFYVVAYNGHDPITGRERRRWHPAGTERTDAVTIQRRIDRQRPIATCELSMGGFMATTWLATKRGLTRHTANRYRWMIDHNITPRIGAIRLDALRPADLDACYADLTNNGGRRRQGLAPKTVLEIHRVISNALDLAVDRQLIDTNPARRARPPRPTSRSTVPAIWDAQQLAQFLHAARHLRLYPALHLVAHTGMRRGEVAGLNWGDLHVATSSVSIVRTRQATMGRTVESPVKTRTSRRRIDLDANTLHVLERWRHRLATEGATIEPSTPMFLNAHHCAPSPESFSQLFTRTTATCRLPRIRFHDLRHTHASLLVAAGVPIKVVSERLGHAHPDFTMQTYQHLLPGMGAAAASQFAALIDTSR
ncbi:MAG: site-specific integrase [Ilumatobacteraceae bacterium]